MVTHPWEMVAVFGSCVILIYGLYKSQYIKAYLVGMLFGVFWEFSTYQLFDYQNFTFYVWQDIPIAIILMWGVAIAGFRLISDLIQARFKIKSNSMRALGLDILVVGTLGPLLEVLGFGAFKLWTYPETQIPTVGGMPFVWPIAWLIFGVLILSLLRRFDMIKPEKVDEAAAKKKKGAKLRKEKKQQSGKKGRLSTAAMIYNEKAAAQEDLLDTISKPSKT